MALLSFLSGNDLFSLLRPRFKWGVVMLWCLLWLAGWALNGFRNPTERSASLALFALACLLVIFLSTALVFSDGARARLLVPGANIDGRRAHTLLVAVVTAVMAGVCLLKLL